VELDQFPFELISSLTKPLGNREPHEMVSTRIVWHPNWLGNVNDDVNALYIKEIVNLVWENEKVQNIQFDQYQ
jgi:hypothetical protein